MMMRTTLAALLAVTAAPENGAEPSAQSRAEVRALWVDGFHAGIRSQNEVEDLVAHATRARLNTLFVQVRRRGDALYTGGLEPGLDDPSYSLDFDGLAAVVEAGHRAGLRIHAWINAMPIWRDEAPPRDPRHVFNQHGPDKTGPDSWLTRSREGAQKFPVGYFLDPGHPAVQEHLVRVYLDITRRYAIDGIHFDYIRYPETDERLPRGSNVGYNEVSLARFQRATGRTDVPAPGDEAWVRWRRQQVTELVRRVSIEARALKPRIQVSAATIAWGEPPKSRKAFDDASPMQRIFQNWRDWLQEGLLDLAAPMNYAREHDPRVREWFNGWIEWEKRNKSGRHLVVGIGAYLNTEANVLAQVSRTRSKAGGHFADGVSFFSYFRPSSQGPPEGAEGLEPSPDRLDFLTQGVEGARPALVEPAPVPETPWIDRPSRGFIAGHAVDGEGKALDGATVRIRQTGWFRKTERVKTDGNGWFGITGRKPGRYTVRIELPPNGRPGEPVTVEVRAGVVTRLPAALVGRSQ